MGARNLKVLQVISGWQAVELILKCVFVGIWQIIEISVKGLWKGARRKVKDTPPVELTIDSSVGTHCYIKVMGVKYHYVETGPRTGQKVLILKDAPDSGNLWGPNWANAVRRLAETDHHVMTLDLRGTGGSEGGSRSELSPPRAVEELSALLKALGVTENRPAVVIGFGVGGMLAWYLVHSRGPLISKFAVINAPHPNLYWQFPPAAFCHRVLHFIQMPLNINPLYLLQWPHFPERWFAEGELNDCDGRWASSRACDWTGALNYIRGAAWWHVRPGLRTSAPALLVGDKDSAGQLVASAQHCTTSTLRLVTKPEPNSKELAVVLLDFLISKEKFIEEVPRGLMGRMFGAVADRGRELTARLVLPPTQA
ncbi:epoxide hydrolase 4-like isoform X1 [Helicoverpa zea]|uniref:epoxide hydrolase 4-like isoform X1 n=1 Tax=Helicoverpa zea TaxID=7113 RepID=UPI001F58C589|nr:epoxide hydrolase 4-like isoform X1 [Helicoverpa zea]